VSANSLKAGFQSSPPGPSPRGTRGGFDYRGDITITRKDGSKVEGYLFDRRSGYSLTDSFVRIIPDQREDQGHVAYSDIAALAFTGRDTAAGKTFESLGRKVLGQEGSRRAEHPDRAGELD